MSFTLIILLTQLASANFSDQDAHKQKTEAQRAASAADSELPPCEGHDHLDDVVSKFMPASCPKTKLFYEYQLERSRKIRETCRETIRWMEEKLRYPAYCSSPPLMRANLNRLQELKTKSQGEEEPAEIDKLLDDPQLEAWFEHGRAPPTKGEWARLECRHGLEMAMQFRSRQRALAQKHFGSANYALDAVCDEGQKAANEYLDLLRFGEDGE